MITMVIESHSPHETKSWGRRLASILEGGELLGLIGDLTPYPYRFHLEQHRLTPILFEKLQAFPHAMVYFSTQLLDATQHGDSVSVKTTGENFETPWLIELEKQYQPKGFEILGVSFDDLDKDDPKLLAKDKADIAKSVAQLHIPYPVLLDGDSIAKPYGDGDVYPTSYFVDRSGTIVAATFGLTSKSDLEGNILKALGEGK